MTKPIHPKNDGRRAFCGALLASMAIGSTSCAYAIDKDIPMSKPSNTPMTLWQAIAKLSQQIPFTKEGVEKVLATKLTLTAVQGNEYFWVYESDSVALAGGATLKVDLRIKREGVHPGFLVINLSGSCFTLAEVRSHYEELQITDHPRGSSLNESTSYTAALSWGALSFSFKEREPDWLSSVAFKPKKL
jgi:hypothetical protein